MLAKILKIKSITFIKSHRSQIGICVGGRGVLTRDGFYKEEVCLNVQLVEFNLHIK